MTLPLLVAAACGVLLSAALPPGGLWPLLLALAPPFGMAAAAPTPRSAFAVGVAFALPLFTLHIWWLPASFAVPFGPAFWLLFPLLLAALAAIWGGMFWLARLVGGRGRGPLWLLPALWVLVEWARTQGYLGFPWGVLGYGWLDTPVAQLADTLGVYGLGLLTSAAAALLAAPFVPAGEARGYGAPRRDRRRWLAPLAALALLALGWGAGALTERRLAATLAPPERSALLVQADLDPFAAVLAGPELRAHTDLTVRGLADLEMPPDLVVWPEGAVSGSPLLGAAGAEARRAIQASAPGAAFVVGGRRVSENGRSHNSVFGLAAAEVRSVYDKRLLVPFGERFPFLETAAPLYRSIFGLFGLPMLASTWPGDAFVPLTTPAGVAAAYVCYESVFPQVTRAMVRQGAQLLVNVTNDAWFARGAGARQHFDMGRLRAIETRRWLLRAANDGITGAVDPLGRTTAELPRGVASSLLVRYALEERVTPYVRYGGLLPWLLLGYALLGGATLTLRREG